ncbi:alpha-ketoacid dehydrogenase subunit beta [Actinomadura welshii]|uniref:alpha-ketoacid dehydrogenase subunit beta n=1 Tax=Actinomadura welshii TaxID=3103817 RepID=UPI0003AD0F61|nr:transketolase C-terminal domain-containing protein [Actinomadura madurae]
MSHEIPFVAAIAEAVHGEMSRDEDVVLFGQTIGEDHYESFRKAFPGERVRVTPISETAEIGMAAGAALAGKRPVVDCTMAEFLLVAMDQVVNEANRFHYMSGGRVTAPMVLKAGYGFAAGWGAQHSNSIYGMFLGVPGLKVALPSTPADAKGLMTSAIRDDNPVLYLHSFLQLLETGPVPEGEHVVPFGVADVKRPGTDVTVVATGWTVSLALAAAERLAAEGTEAEVIDPRTIAPLDTETVLASVARTGRLVLVDQAPRHGSVATVIAGEVAEHGWSYLRAPIMQVTALDAPIAYARPMEEYVLPDEERIVEAARKVVGAPAGRA